jgi:hypothetical protein
MLGRIFIAIFIELRPNDLDSYLNSVDKKFKQITQIDTRSEV